MQSYRFISWIFVFLFWGSCIAEAFGQAFNIPEMVEVTPPSTEGAAPTNRSPSGPPIATSTTGGEVREVSQPPPAASPQPLSKEAEQVLFCVDDSVSMHERGFDPLHPLTSRWEIAGNALPQWLNGLDKDTLTGAVSVGGSCGSAPSVELPVGSERGKIADIFNTTTPHGNTNLNAVLKRAPDYFSKGVQGRKRIVLMSDGLNTCPPQESTCEIVKALHKEHGITVDVVAFVTDPQMVQEFECVASVSGGTFFARSNVKELLNLPLFSFNPWLYLVLVLGLVTLLLAAQILYRHSYHVFHWDSQRSILSATLLFVLGSLTLYCVLFVGAGLASAIMGVVVLGATLAMVLRKDKPSGRFPPSGVDPWRLVALLAPLAVMTMEIGIRVT